MKNLKPFILGSLLFLFTACSIKKAAKTQAATGKSANDELIFQTGFEGSTRIIRNAKISEAISHYAIDDIVGKDTTLPVKNDFVADLDNRPGSGEFMLEYTGGDSTKRQTRIITEPGKTGNKVLEFWLNEPWEASEHQIKARIQADIYSIKPGLKEFYQSERVFLTDDFNVLKQFPEKISWLTISEFWNNEWWVDTEKYGFRVTLGIGKVAGPSDDLYFILNAEDAGQKEVWNANTAKVKVPVGKWFTMEYYYKEGDRDHGRFYMAVTPEGEQKKIVFDVTNFTHNTTDPAPNGVTGYSPMKLYTSKEVINYVRAQGKTLRIYWDDFKLWRHKLPE